jgi:hypothetical protein
MVSAAVLACAATAANAAPVHTSMEANVIIGGQPSGRYREETVIRNGHIEDTVEQVLVFNRLGSSVEVSETDTYEEDIEGRILAGSARTSSSKNAVTMDYVVRGATLALTTHSGGRDYQKDIPITGTLFGPAGMRRMLLQATSISPDIHYETFVAPLGGEALVTLKYLGGDVVEGVQVRKFSEALQGMPGSSTLWVDANGYTVQTTMDSPFGPIRITRGKPVTNVGAELPKETYERTLAISNIKLPHPRLLESVTVEITKKPGADPQWPDFSSATQTILDRSGGRVTLRIVKPRIGEKTPEQPGIADTESNALIQSDDPNVIALAKNIAGSESDPWKKALLLQAWVAANMQFDTGIAVAPASELVRDKHGTCMGYSILLASLARAEKIPARIRMGYVYDDGIWGGHAWTEMFVRGQWLPVDSAEYYPGIADAARIGVITVEGENGTIEHAGDLALLFGKIDVRTLGYSLGGKTVSVARSDPAYTVDDDSYTNAWLGLTVRKPAGFAFGDLDAHWPNHDVLTLTSAEGSVHIAYLRAGDAPMEKEIAEQLSVHGHPQSISWNSVSALRIDGAGKSALAFTKGDVMWAILAESRDSSRLLDKAAAATSISDGYEEHNRQ